MSSVSFRKTAGFCDSTIYVVQLVRIMELLYSRKSRKPRGTFILHQNMARFVVLSYLLLIILHGKNGSLKYLKM